MCPMPCFPGLPGMGMVYEVLVMSALVSSPTVGLFPRVGVAISIAVRMRGVGAMRPGSSMLFLRVTRRDAARISLSESTTSLVSMAIPRSTSQRSCRSECHDSFGTGRSIDATLSPLSVGSHSFARFAAAHP